MKEFTKREAEKVLNTLESMFPNAKTELNFKTPFQLLVAVILSAQCTDKRVNEVTKELFKVCSTPLDFVKIPTEELEKLIYSCGFYKNKAKHIKEASKDIVDRFNGKVPNNKEDLLSLSGVGIKTANVVGSVAFDIPAIAVDTHVFRVSKRIGLAFSNTPEKVEKELEDLIEMDRWNKAHHLFIFLGRYMCHSQKPDCENCKLKTICQHYKKVNDV